MGRGGPSAPREAQRPGDDEARRRSGESREAHRRQSRYEKADSRQYQVVVETGGEAVGWVGYWERTWRDQQVWEIGWSVLPGSQGRGIASSATAQLIDLARAEQQLRFVHAFPSVENAPSNAICRKLGFTLLGEIEFEVVRTPGSFMRCNDWRLDLFASS